MDLTVDDLKQAATAYPRTGIPSRIACMAVGNGAAAIRQPERLLLYARATINDKAPYIGRAVADTALAHVAEIERRARVAAENRRMPARLSDYIERDRVRKGWIIAGEIDERYRQNG